MSALQGQQGSECSQEELDKGQQQRKRDRGD